MARLGCAVAEVRRGGLLLLNCFNTATVASENSALTGGIAGSVTGSEGGTIEIRDCENSGDVFATASPNRSASWLVAMMMAMPMVKPWITASGT